MAPSSDPPSAGDSFAALFEQQQKTAAPRARTPRVGDVLEATVVQIGKDTVFVELDGKRQAFIDAVELRGPDGTLPVAVGETLRARVVEIEPQTGNVRLGRSLGRPGSSAAIEQAKEAGVAIEGKVTAVNKGGLEVEVAGTRAFCPISQADSKYVQDPSSFVGRSLQFLVTDVRDGGKSVVLSRRALLEREAREAAERVKKDLLPGTVVRGTVTGVREFGAFVDLGGVEGLIPASEIGHDRSVAVADALSPGDSVEVQVREVKEGTTARGEPTTKITLSLKALAKDPWEDVERLAPVGKVVMGTVTRVVDFGAFVRVASGLEGLLHVSELGGRPDHPGRVLTPGQSIAVVVKSVDRGEKRIALVPAPEGAKAGAAVSTPKIAIGAIVSGTVDRIETYGVFLQLEGTKGRAGRGLIPTAELGVPRGVDLRKTFPEGTKLTAKVLEIGDGRMRLSLRAVKDDEERAQYEGFRDKAAAPGKLGTLGDLLKNKATKR